MAEGIKICRRCNIPKPLSSFGLHPDTRDGRQSNCLSCGKELTKAFRAKTGYRRKRSLQKLYGITIEDYNNMFAAQQGKCAICGRHQSEFDRIFVVDHDHTTGVVRGLLCSRCNNGLGMFQDSTKLLVEAIRYLTP